MRLDVVLIHDDVITSLLRRVDAMSLPHKTRFNNYIPQPKKLHIDCITKIFITLQWVLGINRVGAFCKNLLLHMISFIYTIFIIGFVCFYTYNCIYHHDISPVEYQKLIQYIICCVLGFSSRQKLQRFYEELEKFDEVACYEPKVCRDSILTLLSMVSICLSVLPVFHELVFVGFIPTHIIQVTENHFIGFLFILLNKRLRSVNMMVESSLYHKSLTLSKSVILPSVDGENKKPQVTVSKLMDFYYVIISAYDHLTDGIKWQLLFIVISSFIYTLCISYNISLYMLQHVSPDGKCYHTLSDFTVVASEMLPLIAPCMCCDIVRREVRRLRELLASKLYESKLDKINRSVARALLTLTESRNLSFTLLRMFDVSISLPFSFLGLLATYLIILLQFEKVINPNDLTTTSPSP